MKITFFAIKRILVILALISILVALLVISQVIYIDNTSPSVMATYPRVETSWDTYTKPIEISFTVPVRKSTLKPTITPDIDGEWIWDSWLGIDNLVISGKFFPHEYVFSNQRFVVYIAGVGREGFDESHELGFVFDAPKIPVLIKSDPIHNSSVYDLNELNFYLDKELEQNQTILVQVTPKTSFDLLVDGRGVNIRLTEQVSKGTKYTFDLSVVEISNNEEMHTEVGKIDIYTRQEVGFRGIMPLGDKVIPNSKIKIRFFEDMDQNSVIQNLKVEPQFDFEVFWDNAKQLEIRYAGELQRDTTYHITINKGTKKSDGMLSQTDLKHSFKTLGRLTLLQASPSNGASRVAEYNPIELYFDQPIDRELFSNFFYISPSVPGRLEWISDSAIRFVPNIAFPFSTNIEVGVLPGVKTVWGLPNEVTLSINFQTRANQFVISLPTCSPYSPEYCQPQYPVSFSCNIYALKIALAWKGFLISAPAIIAEMGYNDSFVSGNWTGNPYKEYVGNADGSWGYGVYWGPTQQILTNRGIGSQLVTHWNTVGLAKTLEQGSPVIIWRYNGTSSSGIYYWTANDGAQVKAIRGQHGGVVTGFRGSSDAPTHFLINDPWFGSIWLDTNTFDYYWSFLDRVGLIVY